MFHVLPSTMPLPCILVPHKRPGPAPTPQAQLCPLCPNSAPQLCPYPLYPYHHSGCTLSPDPSLDQFQLCPLPCSVPDSPLNPDSAPPFGHSPASLALAPPNPQLKGEGPVEGRTTLAKRWGQSGGRGSKWSWGIVGEEELWPEGRDRGVAIAGKAEWRGYKSGAPQRGKGQGWNHVSLALEVVRSLWVLRMTCGEPQA